MPRLPLVTSEYFSVLLNMMDQKVSFWQVFRAVEGNRLTPQVILNVNGTVIGPGVTIGSGTAVGGIDFFKIYGRELAVEIKENVYILKGYYGPPVNL